jgi:hypothetical protein
MDSLLLEILNNAAFQYVTHINPFSMADVFLKGAEFSPAAKND